MSSVIRHDQWHHPLLETDCAVQVLWPALHYAIPDAPKTKSFYESASWAQYQSVNQRFANVIIANHREGDISTYTSRSLYLLYSRVFQSGSTTTI
jgi:hypothetical protein